MLRFAAALHLHVDPAGGQRQQQVIAGLSRFAGVLGAVLPGVLAQHHVQQAGLLLQIRHLQHLLGRLLVEGGGGGDPHEGLVRAEVVVGGHVELVVLERALDGDVEQLDDAHEVLAPAAGRDAGASAAALRTGRLPHRVAGAVGHLPGVADLEVDHGRQLVEGVLAPAHAVAVGGPLDVQVLEAAVADGEGVALVVPAVDHRADLVVLQQVVTGAGARGGAADGLGHLLDLEHAGELPLAVAGPDNDGDRRRGDDQAEEERSLEVHFDSIPRTWPAAGRRRCRSPRRAPRARRGGCSWPAA